MNPTSSYLTEEKLKALEAELDMLKTEKRKEILEALEFAKSLGDLSENAEYQYGKKRLREIDGRLRFLDKRISAARIVNQKEQIGDKILFGATVTLQNEDGKKVVYQIVGEDESNISLKKISWKSPLGHNLLNKKIGDFIIIEVPAGVREFEVLSFQF